MCRENSLEYVEVLIRVAVAGVNPTDTWTRDGAYPDWCMRIYVPSFPWTPGRDVAGTVERVGSKVSRLKVRESPSPAPGGGDT